MLETVVEVEVLMPSRRSQVQELIAHGLIHVSPSVADSALGMPVTGLAASAMIGPVAARIAYFAYGTLQTGFANHAAFAHVLGDRICRVQTDASFAVVVPKARSCSNPGCGLLHRMAALVPDMEPLRAEGDLFLVDEDGLAALDRLEGCTPGNNGPYVRREIDVLALDGSERWRAQAYPVSDAQGWRDLVARGAADALARFDAELALGTEPKACCVREPGHPGPHDVIDPLLDR